MSRRGRAGSWLAACAVAASVLGALVATPAGAAPTGSPRGIALFRAAARATNALPAYVITQTGYVRIDDSLAPTRRVHFAWGWAQFQRGYRAAKERLVLVQHSGRTIWLEDTLTPTGACHAECAMVPIELLITRTIAFEGLVSSGTQASCFERVGLRHVPYPAGGPWWAPFGSLSAPVPDRALTEITSRFASGPQRVVESDWLRVTNRVFARSGVKVAAGGGRPAYAYASTDALLKAVPRFPTITICS